MAVSLQCNLREEFYVVSSDLKRMRLRYLHSIRIMKSFVLTSIFSVFFVRQPSLETKL